MDLEKITPEQIVEIYKLKGYKLFEDDSKDMNLNLIGIRCVNEITDLWDDILCDLWKFNGEWNLKIRKGTTKPGKYVFNHLPVVAGVKGTFLLKEGQYPSMWSFKEKGHFNHDALMQKSLDITGYRITEMKYDLSTAPEQNGKEVGIDFGIDNHSVWNAPLDYIFPVVGNWGEGCQVTAKQNDHQEHLERVKIAIENWGNSFAYTLLNITDFN